jgi:ribulose-phosphate 3-epimerase
MSKLQLAPSILTADFGKLADEIASVEPYVDWFHLDVMDGHYVPNLTFGPDIVAAINKVTDLPLHVHLMIENPLTYAPRFAEAGADRISFHPEVVDDVGDAVGAIRDLGVGPGLAVHPDVGLEPVEPHLGKIDVVLMMTVRPGFGGQDFLSDVVPSIARAKSMVQAANSSADIEVDGGVKLSTVQRAVDAGGEIVVAGSAIFDGVDAAAAAKRLRAKLDELEGSAG